MHKLLESVGPPVEPLGGGRVCRRDHGDDLEDRPHPGYLHGRGIYFTASPSNTVGVKLSQLKDGDKVTVHYADDPAEQMSIGMQC